MHTTDTQHVARRRVGFAAAVLLLAAPLASCGDSTSNAEHDKNAATVEQIKGSELKRVTLTEAAAKRLDLAVAKVTKGAAGLQIPYAAVLYDPDGHTWTFANVEGLTFERKPIAVRTITGDVASLDSGPAIGTIVVTQGINELYGAEIGVGDE